MRFSIGGVWVRIINDEIFLCLRGCMDHHGLIFWMCTYYAFIWTANSRLSLSPQQGTDPTIWSPLPQESFWNLHYSLALFMYPHLTFIYPGRCTERIRCSSTVAPCYSLTFISLEGGSCRGKIASPVETLWEHKGNMQSRPASVFCSVLFPQGRVIRFLHSKQTCNQPFFIFWPECNYSNILQYTMSSNYRGWHVWDEWKFILTFECSH